jgi:hypothetical protein
MKYLDLTAVEGDPWGELYVFPVFQKDANVILTTRLPSPELQIEFWAVNEFWPPDSPEVPPVVLPFDAIKCQLSRGTIDTTEPPLWVTTSMERVRIQHAMLGISMTVSLT